VPEVWTGLCGNQGGNTACKAWAREGTVLVREVQEVREGVSLGPQVEDGFTKIANELLEAFATLPLNGTQWRIIMVVLRYTYGFNRKSAKLSETFIAKATKINSKQINREIRPLIDNNILIIEQSAAFNSPRVLKLNKHYKTWVSTKTLTGNKNEGPPELVGLTVNGLVDSGVNGLVDQERNNKEIIKKRILKEQNEFFESIWRLYPNKKGKGKISQSQKAKLYKLGFETLKKCIDRYKATKEDWKAWQNGSTFFNSGYIDYLDENFTEEKKEGSQCDGIACKYDYDGDDTL